MNIRTMTRPKGLVFCFTRTRPSNVRGHRARPPSVTDKGLRGVPEKPDRLFGEEEAQRSGELFRKENDERSLC